jgi:hypothetical protein
MKANNNIEKIEEKTGYIKEKPPTKNQLYKN